MEWPPCPATAYNAGKQGCPDEGGSNEVPIPALWGQLGRAGTAFALNKDWKMTCPLPTGSVNPAPSWRLAFLMGWEAQPSGDRDEG